MITYHSLFGRYAAILLFGVSLCYGAVAIASDNYEYGDGEYVTIYRGMSPNGRYAITAHGEGEDGLDNFHLYVTDAKTGKHIQALEQIVDELDSGADSYKAQWSRDSQRVVIVYRISRHLPIKATYYRFSHGRALLSKGPVDATERQISYWGNWVAGAKYTGRTFGTTKAHAEPN